jgi:HK97 family phage major capsid protein
MPDVVDVESDVVKLRAEIDRLNKEAVEKRAVADKMREDMRASGLDLASLHESDADSFTRIDEAYKEADVRVQQAHELRERLEKLYGWTGRTNGNGRARADGPRRRQTIGRRVVDSDAYHSLVRSGAPTQEKARINMDPVTVLTREELMDMLRARAGLDLPSGQSLITPDLQIFPPVEIPVRQVRLLDLINKETTNSDIIYWTKQTSRVLAAAPTATGTNAPSATLGYQRQTSTVRRIPVMITAPREVLADEGRVQGILDNELEIDIRLGLEAQTLTGNGTGENFTGIVNTAGIGTVAQGGTDYALDAIHRAITYVRLHLFLDPDGIGLHPVDLETIVLQRDGMRRYIFEPTDDQTRIWGFPVVATPVFTQGTGLVGNFRLGATLWLREDVAVTASDGYTDTATGVNYFAAGLVAILAQLRAAFAVTRPFAFAEVTGLANLP